MRRMTAVVAVCLCAVTGCRGGAAQEPYDGIGTVARAPSSAVPVPQVPAPAVEPIASEVDVPWTIALLSDVEARHVEARGDVVHDEPVATAEESRLEESVDLEVVVEHDLLQEKPATSAKSCPGVVKGRS
jgi:hypothetical protein